MNAMLNNTTRLLHHSRTVTVACLFLISGCVPQSESDSGPDPLVEDFGIAYIAGPLPAMQTASLTEMDVVTPGTDLFFRDLAAPGIDSRNITAAVTGGAGDVRDVAVSRDGRRLLFSLRLADIPGLDDEDQPTWNIWEYDLDTEQLRRIINDDITAEAGEDIAPRYLPDGRIVFSSSRQRRARAVLLDEGKPQFSGLDEAIDEPAMTLHVMEDDGTSIEQISFNQSHDLQPAVLPDGKVVFARWDNAGEVDQVHLYRVRPDGTELELLYGANSHETGTGGSDIEFSRPRIMPSGEILVVARPGNEPGLGGDLWRIRTDVYVDNTQPLANNIGILTGPAQQAATANNVITDGTPSTGGRFHSAFPLYDNTNRALVSWSPCRLRDGADIVACTPANLNAGLPEAEPLYGLFMYDMDNHTQVPVFEPEEGRFFRDVVATQPRPTAPVLFDKQPGIDLDLGLANESAGVLNIRSVYDFDGAFFDFGSGATGIAELADPAQATAAQRPARFVRIVKAVAIPGEPVLDLPGFAFGINNTEGMREIVGYAPVEPDGSVRVKVPANTALDIHVLDANAKRLRTRHNNWLQVVPGEEQRCQGCHDATAALSHGRQGTFDTIYAGAPADGHIFTNTTNSIFANFGETMAEARTRLDPDALNLDTDPAYSDVWTDAAAAGRPADADTSLPYSGLTTPVPATPGCQTTWTPLCRTVINYETHIHPLWNENRGANTCTACHTDRDAGNNPQIPDAQLDLTDGPSDQNNNHFKAYRELLAGDNEQILDMGILVDREVQATDEFGNLLFLTDAQGNLVLDGMNNPIPVMVPVPITSPMSRGGALTSPRFFSRFEPGGSHAGWLNTSELRLLAEWLDIGAQYYNNPFDVPP